MKTKVVEITVTIFSIFLLDRLHTSLIYLFFLNLLWHQKKGAKVCDCYFINYPQNLMFVVTVVCLVYINDTWHIL